MQVDFIVLLLQHGCHEHTLCQCQIGLTVVVVVAIVVSVVVFTVVVIVTPPFFSFQ